MAQPPRGLSQLGRQAIWVLRDEGQGHGPFSPPPSSPATCCILFIVKLGFLGAAFLDTAVPSSHSCLSPQRSSEPLEHSSAPTLSPAIFPSRPWHPLVMAYVTGTSPSTLVPSPVLSLPKPSFILNPMPTISGAPTAAPLLAGFVLSSLTFFPDGPALSSPAS